VARAATHQSAFGDFDNRASASFGRHIAVATSPRAELGRRDWMDGEGRFCIENRHYDVGAHGARLSAFRFGKAVSQDRNVAQ
jgi:hypothetical protein